MGLIKLEPPCPKSVNGLSLDPNPNWSFNDLLSELNSLESKLKDSSSPLNPRPFVKTTLREIPRGGNREKVGNTFVMRVEDDEFEFDDSDVESGADESRCLVPAARFVCDDLYLSDSDDSENEDMQPMQVTVMDKMGVVEGAYLELAHERQLGVKEEIRNQLSTLETQLVSGKAKSASALVQVEKNSNARRQMDRQLDMHYQRYIAESLDNHLTAIQRDHEHLSQMEERRIRQDAAIEEAKRKEKALQEEKLRQQKAKAEEELQARLEAAKRAEQRKAAEEAERAKEAADELAKRDSAKSATLTVQNAPAIPTPDVAKATQSTGIVVRASDNALKLEDRRLQSNKELEERNQSIISGSNADLRPKEREIARRIKQIGGSVESVKSKAEELLKIFKDPAFPQSISVTMFSKKVPAVMDCLLAEFHKVCMYTVPKHIVYLKTTFPTKESYFKAIGYREEDGTLETTDHYLERLGSYMKLYGAIVQTEPQYAKNMHGLEEGWIWLARFLNALPANLYTAVALEAFLRMAGFALYRKYKSQFRKILNVISQQFLHALKARGDPKINSVITRLQDYIESNRFTEEPEGWRLIGSLASSSLVPEEDYQQQYNHTSYGRYY